jgi:transposase
VPPVDRLHPIRAASSDSQFSLMEFMREFPDDDACLVYLWRTRHAPDGETAYCPKCEGERTFKRYKTAQRRQSWTCTACGHHVHPTAGTIFHKSSTSLHLWFYAMYLMASTKCGLSAKHLGRELGVHYKTAWRMFNKIRNYHDAGRDAAFGGPKASSRAAPSPRNVRSSSVGSSAAGESAPSLCPLVRGRS